MIVTSGAAVAAALYDAGRAWIVLVPAVLAALDLAFRFSEKARRHGFRRLVPASRAIRVAGSSFRSCWSRLLLNRDAARRDPDGARPKGNTSPFGRALRSVLRLSFTPHPLPDEVVRVAAPHVRVLFQEHVLHLAEEAVPAGALAG